MERIDYLLPAFVFQREQGVLLLNLFFTFFFAILEFELRALCLLGNALPLDSCPQFFWLLRYFLNRACIYARAGVDLDLPVYVSQ
jgi:hypothetical protein